MAGELKVESEFGRGSRFWFDVAFPVYEGIKVETVHRTNVVGYKGKRLKALVADDNPANLELLKAMLVLLGFEVLIATDGLEEVEIAKLNKPDTIFTDIRMPGMDGNTAVKKIREMPELRKIPIIAVSASVMDENRQHSIEAGCSGFLAKPVELPTLVEVLKNNLELEWIYEEDKVEEAVLDEQAISRYHLSPSEKVDMIIDAVTNGSVTELTMLISKINEMDDRYKTFTTKIETLIKEYRFDEVIEFLANRERK